MQSSNKLPFIGLLQHIKNDYRILEGIKRFPGLSPGRHNSC